MPKQPHLMQVFHLCRTRADSLFRTGETERRRREKENKTRCCVARVTLRKAPVSSCSPAPPPSAAISRLFLRILSLQHHRHLVLTPDQHYAQSPFPILILSPKRCAVGKLAKFPPSLPSVLLPRLRDPPRGDLGDCGRALYIPSVNSPFLQRA